MSQVEKRRNQLTFERDNHRQASETHWQGHNEALMRLRALEAAEDVLAGKGHVRLEFDQDKIALNSPSADYTNRIYLENGEIRRAVCNALLKVAGVGQDHGPQTMNAEPQPKQ